MSSVIKIKRGLEASLSSAGVVAGELKYTTDKQHLFIGDGTNNVLLNDAIVTVAALPTTGIKTDKFYYLSTADSTHAVGLYYYYNAAWYAVGGEDTAAHSLSLTMDSSTFVVTAVLKDKDGTALSTQTIDLPLEQMKIASLTYDNTNKKFIITYIDATGTQKTVELPASGILKGVVTETAEQELTNKTIDAEDNTISNLALDNFADGVVVDSTTGIAAAASASDDKTVTEKAVAVALTAKADASSVYTKTEVDGKLADKQDNLSEEQLAAANSGITSEKVAAYDAYEADIAAKIDTAQGAANEGKILMVNASGNLVLVDTIDGGTF